MNCKPGDLAIVVRGLDLDPPPKGAIVRLARISRVWSDAWELDPPVFCPVDGREIHVPDHHLRPIRPQADDATDETLTWLDVPTKQGETA